MLDSMKLCLSSQLNQAKKLLQKLSFSEKSKSRNRRKPSSYMDVSAQLRRVFDLIDTDGDGKLSAVELERVLLISAHDKKTAAKEAETMMREMDFNGDGFVDLDEFMSVMGVSYGDGINNVFKESEIMEAFRVFDGDGDGLISAEEVHGVLERVIGCGKCSVRECRKMIEGVDRDGDGFVSFEEFKCMMSVGC